MKTAWALTVVYAALVITAPAEAAVIDSSLEPVIVTDVGGGTFTFVQSGFTEGASVTGSFTGTDLNGNGLLEFFPFDPGPFEVTAFAASFSGNALVPAFALDFAGLDGLAYDFDGDIGGDGLVGATYANGGWASGSGPGRLCDGVAVCGEVSFDVPEPASLVLFGLGALTLGLAVRRRA
jgi:hypothetical protein